MPFGPGGLLAIRKLKELPRNQLKVSLDLEAFPSAAEAERAGRLLAFSIMWLAASKKITIGFAKWTGSSPFAIRDRTRSDGATVEAEGRGYLPLKASELSSEVARAYQKGATPDESLITSMPLLPTGCLDEPSALNSFLTKCWLRKPIEGSARSLDPRREIVVHERSVETKYVRAREHEAARTRRRRQFLVARERSSVQLIVSSPVETIPASKAAPVEAEKATPRNPGYHLC